ncbi:MAG TPA: PilZ domain-containing protein [Vicinamibacterales bacterium]|nr:PilZ domain-containing protein [Vicinamibacterales bacterium]
MRAFAERRQMIRIAVRGKVTVATSTPGPSLQLVDVSVGGFAVRSAAPLPIGIATSYRFATADRKWSAFLDARVIYCKVVSLGPSTPEYLTGLAFVNVDASYAHRELMALMDHAINALSAS